MAARRLDHIAIVGASGNIGKYMTAAVLASPARFATVTVVTRADSKATFPAGVTVRRADMQAQASIAAALQGVQGLVITLPFGPGAPDQLTIIDAAADAGVAYILPNEFGSDTAHPAIAEIPADGAKAHSREYIAERGMKWIALVTNPWIELALSSGWLNINVAERTASFWDDGRAKGRFSSMVGVGNAVAALLALPLKSADGEPSLDGYANGYVYTSSFILSQHDILASVQRATGTKRAEWKVSYTPLEAVLQDGRAKTLSGDHSGVFSWLFGSVWAVGRSGMFEGRPIANEELGLPPIDLDERVRIAVQDMK